MQVRPSLQRKLVALVIAAIGTATVVSTAIALWQQTINYASLRTDALVTTAQVFAAAAAPATRAVNRDGAFGALRGMARINDISYAEVRTASGAVLASFGATARLTRDLSVTEKESASLTAMLESGTIEVAVPIIESGARVGQFTLIGGTADLRSKLFATAALTLGAGVVALLIGLLVAWRFQRRITQPLRGLLAAMMRIRQEHRYDVSVSRADDREIGELVDGFNKMLGDIRERDSRLEAHARNLEDEVKARTSDLRVAMDAAESANRAKSDFLATMSHEIRTPMNGIMVMAELLAQANLPPRQQRFADVITRSGRSLIAIINDILDFSKIEAGKLQVEHLPIDLIALAENVTSLFAERAREKGVDLAALVDPNVPRSILSDPTRLGQVIGNLVNNALKFTEKGCVKLVIKAHLSDESIEIAVSDTGIGIAEDKIGTIFESFSQADQSTTRNFGGTGLGLTISQRLVHALGGTIKVASRLGEGSTFSVSLPAGRTGAPSWPKLALGKGDLAFCILDIGGEATRAALSRYFSASGYTVLERDGSMSDEHCASAALIVFDDDKVGTYGGRGKAGPRLIGVFQLGSPEVDHLVKSGKVDGSLTKPLLRSEIEGLLHRLSRGERILQPATDNATKVEPVSRLRPFRALVADDNAVNREVAFEALSQLKASVVAVENGLEAVKAATSGRFDIVFMDGSMPIMDGFEAARRIRAEESGTGRRTPIVALTAHVVGAAADEWRNADMDDIVYKPFTVMKLVQTIEKQLPHLALGNSAGMEPDVVPASASASTLLDAAVLRQLRQLQENGQEGFVKKVLGLYVEHAPTAVGEILHAKEAGNAGDCARAAHALKSMSLNIGARDMAALASEIENQCKVHDRIPDQREIETLDKALAAAVQAINHLAEFGGQNLPGGHVTEAEERDDDLEHALAQAIERKELSVVYQPIVDRNGAQVSAVEALVRWKRNGESISPAVFIPIAEETGSIHDIGAWVLRQACNDARAWPGIGLSVNVSAIQFRASNLADRIERIVSEAGFDWKRLQLEITETALLNAEDAVLAVMRRLKGNGAAFALDDFGTGYSSLTYLRRFPFDKIKIDQSFIADISLTVNATIVHAVTSIGRSLGLKVVAEGVETTEQQRFLASAGVHFLQGYRFGRPCAPEAITEQLKLERQTFRAG